MRRNPDVLSVLLALMLGGLPHCAKSAPPPKIPLVASALALEPRPTVAESAGANLAEPVSATSPDVAWQVVTGLPAVDGPAAAKPIIVKSKAKIEGVNPYAAWWGEVPRWDAALLPQQMAMPTLVAATVKAVQVQIAHDGARLALRLVWPDTTPNGNVDTGRFSDGVAFQLPLRPDSPPTMGAHGAPVHIHHWKAVWQKDIDVGYQDVQDLHPNFWSDLYWFTSGGHPQPVPAAFTDPTSLQWLVATRAGNPMAILQRTTPCEELAAAGWGTLTHQPTSQTTARGVWANGKWAVVMTRPLATDDASDAKVVPGQANKLAFAVWDGGQGQVGGRKHWTAWFDVEVAP